MENKTFTYKVPAAILLAVSVILLAYILIPKGCNETQIESNVTSKSFYSEQVKKYRLIEKQVNRLKKDSADLAKQSIAQRQDLDKLKAKNKSIEAKYWSERHARETGILPTDTTCQRELKNSDLMVDALVEEIKARDTIQAVTDLQLVNAQEMVSAEREKNVILETSNLSLASDMEQMKKNERRLKRQQFWKGLGWGVSGAGVVGGIVVGGIKAAELAQ